MKRRISSLALLLCLLISGFWFSPMGEAESVVTPEESLDLQSAPVEVSTETDDGRPFAFQPVERGEDFKGGGGVSFQVQANSTSPSPDSDYDGLTDDVEENGWWDAAGFFVTDPLDPDSDSDSLSDGKEKLYGTDPLDSHSPGIYVEYEHHLMTRQYASRQHYSYGSRDYPYPWGWQRFGDNLISLDAVVVRRGSTFSVGGAASATIEITKSLSYLTTLTSIQDPCTGRWRISVPEGGTVGKYGVVLQDGDWSKSLDLYVIFELPTPGPSFTQEMIDAFLYDDDPENLRDETSVLLNSDEYEFTHEDYSQIPEGAWVNAGAYYRFENQQFEPFLFETHVIEAINGCTDQADAAEELVALTDRVTRFNNPRPITTSWRILHPGYDDSQQCSNISGLLAAFARSAGIPARPFFVDWVHRTFDHATEIWFNGSWRSARGYTSREPEGCGWECEYGHNDPTSRYSWGRYKYRPWHSQIPHPHSGIGSVVMTVNEDWPWGLGSWYEYRWPSWDWDAIRRYDWAETMFVPYWSYWGWSQEPRVTGYPSGWPAVTDFVVNAFPSSRTVAQGELVDYTVGAYTSDGFSNHVDFSVRNLPANATPTFSAERCVPNCSSTISISAAFDTPPGTYVLTMRGYSGGLVREDTVTLIVTPPPDFTIDASPDDPPAVEQGGSVDYTVALDSLNDFNDAVILSVSGGPTISTTYQFIPNNSCTPDTHCERTLRVNTQSGAPTGDYILTIRGDSGSLHHQTTVQLHVTSGGGGGGEGRAPEPATVGLSSTSANGGTADGEQADFAVRGVGDDGVDLDGDGFFDQLIIEIEVDVPQAGTYWLQGQLGAGGEAPTLFGTGGLIANAVVRADLTTGINRVRLPFDGRRIFAARVDGAYELKYLTLTDVADPEVDDFVNCALGHWTSLYTTSAYRAHDFQNWGAALSGQFSEQGVDADQDARYESLILYVGLDLFKPGTFAVQGDLHDGQGRFVTQASWTGTGTTAVLQFDGLAGTAGPYTLKEVSLLDAEGEIVDLLYDAYTTQEVIASETRTHIVSEVGVGEFAPQGILLEGYSDSGLDLDGDGLYDLLAIEVPVSVGADGTYRLEGWLEKDGYLISWGDGEPVPLISGTHTISLTFSGPAIHAHNVDGPFLLVALKLLEGSGYGVLDEINVAYTTSFYTTDQFESVPYLEPAPDRVLFFQDLLEGGPGNWAADPPWAIIADQYHTPVNSWTDSPGGDYANDLNVSLSTRAIALTQFGWPILQFQTCYALEDGYDYGYVEISTDDGVTWTPVVTYTGRTVRWSDDKVELKTIGSADTLRVRFRLATDGGVTEDGWYLDSVLVYSDTDLDNDGIPNDVEVGDDPAHPADSDDDGVPDYLDDDSDGDGIPDSEEAGNDPEHPVDSDDDSIPDYLDDDSDGDGIPDSVEAGDDPEHPADSDDDGTPDYLDDDSDGDGIPDNAEGAVDSDDDGILDYLDDDSDGDGIPDSVEGTVDSDGDGIPDYLDDDSDGDSLPDSEEAGDDPEHPADTDGDGIPDYLDEDSDNDGLPDSEDPEPRTRHLVYLPAIFR